MLLMGRAHYLPHPQNKGASLTLPRCGAVYIFSIESLREVFFESQNVPAVGTAAFGTAAKILEAAFIKDFQRPRIF